MTSIQATLPSSVSSGSRETKNNSSTTSRTKGVKTLPACTVEYLKGWMMSPEHISHPYPTEQEKAQIMKETGISMKQLVNWFVNNRKRYWKPRIEARLAQQQLQMQQQQRQQQLIEVSTKIPQQSSLPMIHTIEPSSPTTSIVYEDNQSLHRVCQQVVSHASTLASQNTYPVSPERSPTTANQESVQIGVKVCPSLQHHSIVHSPHPVSECSNSEQSAAEESFNDDDESSSSSSDDSRSIGRQANINDSDDVVQVNLVPDQIYGDNMRNHEGNPPAISDNINVNEVVDVYILRPKQQKDGDASSDIFLLNAEEDIAIMSKTEVSKPEDDHRDVLQFILNRSLSYSIPRNILQDILKIKVIRDVEISRMKRKYLEMYLKNTVARSIYYSNNKQDQSSSDVVAEEYSDDMSEQEQQVMVESQNSLTEDKNQQLLPPLCAGDVNSSLPLRKRCVEAAGFDASQVLQPNKIDADKAVGVGNTDFIHDHLQHKQVGTDPDIPESIPQMLSHVTRKCNDKHRDFVEEWKGACHNARHIYDASLPSLSEAAQMFGFSRKKRRVSTHV